MFSNKLNNIIELLLEKHLDDYFFAYILNWLKESDFQYILDSVYNNYIYKNKKYEITDYKKLKKDLIINFLNDNNINYMIKWGKIVKITKSRNAFISDGSSNIFADKKYIDNKMKTGNMVKYFVIEIYNNEKKCKLPQAVVINVGGNYEVLRSKKRI